MQPAARDATYADLMSLPEDVRAEIIHGQIVALPSPRPRHSRAKLAIGGFTAGPFDYDQGLGGTGGFWIFHEVDIQLGKHVVRPDLAGWRRERLPEPDVRPITVVPDWICEVLSESNEARDRVTKRRIYAEHGVGHYWIADPEARTIEAFTLDRGRWVDAGSFDEPGPARIAPFEAVEVPMAQIFLPRSRAERTP